MFLWEFLRGIFWFFKKTSTAVNMMFFQNQELSSWIFVGSGNGLPIKPEECGMNGT